MEDAPLHVGGRRLLFAAVAGLIYVHRIVGYFVMTDEMTYFKGSFDIWTRRTCCTPETSTTAPGASSPRATRAGVPLGRTTTAYDARTSSM